MKVKKLSNNILMMLVDKCGQEVKVVPTKMYI